MSRTILLTTTLIAGMATTASADTLRLLTWGGYAPDEVIELFEQKTGHTVEVTKSNNEEMIAKLRATGGGGFDLVQPSQDRVMGPQMEFGIYKPIDMSKIDESLFIPSMLMATMANTTVNDEVYGVPHVWGTSGLVLNTAEAGDTVKDYTDLCDPAVAGKVTYRLKRPTLIGFAFAMGEDPFAAYGDEEKYKEIMGKVEAKLTECKANVKTYWGGGDELMNLVRSGEVTASMAWDTGGWKLNDDNADITFVAPASGALGWIDTFVLPAKGQADDVAYEWINFVMQPEIAAMITAAAGNFTASAGADEYVEDGLKAKYQNSFPQEAIDNIKWYPPVPAGLETIEGEVLDRVQAAN
ncbi:MULTISPECIES: extracellular solute-binding protein [Mameliella]|uniref:Extracellular solute-binding protein, family 1 n=1 Tax=Mameliella alba TaxID=561184 RepID=A0A0B3SD89_9RHOB|nr:MULTISPECIES: extracellular solute-binding protein [Mameliella]MBV6638171.1 extracellular solute-binding protein [Mameliella sp.]MCR9272420.1 extracellular solute-binding protein [Paracoccaceae bacterium]ODM46453.1 spermidine/putrescine ABC transporter substrate-binding protein [Ruegeria sp. PBVC088]KHQ54686.1 Extracellular solute-binding protein, family 1 [Mameliella alba]MBY6117729.1 extracellular solute-binding protein [Mameliella alba]